MRDVSDFIFLSDPPETADLIFIPGGSYPDLSERAAALVNAVYLKSSWVDEFSEYFTDGPLLCMRWKNAEEGKTEERDWWEIDSIEGDRMQWTVGTQDEGGIFYTKTIELKKVE